MTSPMKVITATGGLVSTNCYLVADTDARQAVLIDAPDHTVGPLLDRVDREGWTLSAVWFTHGHFDHVADHQFVRGRFANVPQLIHSLDEPKLKAPGSRLFPLPFTIPPGHADGLLEDEQIVRVGGLEAQVLFTPGHSPGHVCFYFAKSDLLLGGDLIIGNAIGRTDLPDSDATAMGDSVRRVMCLPDETTLLGGHGERSTLGEERRTNRYVQHLLAGGKL